MASINKIILHWTAGTNKANQVERDHYHYIVQGDGSVTLGKYKPEDNMNCKDGKYAAHCGGGNTGAIGIALSGAPNTNYPINRQQLEAMCKLAASLSIKYGIRVTSKTIISHAEFGNAHPNTTSYGKVDINRLPCVGIYGVKECGDWLRNKISWYKEKLSS